MKNLFFLFLFIGIFSQAQTQRFIYEVRFKLDSASADFEQTNMILDINPKEVKFYEHDFLRMDSINNANNNFGYRTWGYQNIVTRERNSFKNKNYEMLEDLFMFESEDPIHWKLTNETKQIQQYHLQKATTNFGGRNWEAWFCKEIPYNEGPYKFRGLPGLIFQIQDTENQFIFSMIQSKTLEKTFDTTGFIEKYGGEKPLKVNFKMLQKKKLENYNDPLKDFRLSFDENPNTQFFYGGTQITSKDQLKGYEKQEQELLRKENNPIELDKAIHYPVK